MIPDPEAAAKAWYAKYCLVPVNHMVVATQSLAQSNPIRPRSPSVTGCWRKASAGGRAAKSGPDRLRLPWAPLGKEANRASLELLMSNAIQ